MSPTAPSDPLSPPGGDALSMDVRSASFGGRTMEFKIQFVAPCFIRYYIPSPMVRGRGCLPDWASCTTQACHNPADSKSVVACWPSCMAPEDSISSLA